MPVLSVGGFPENTPMNVEVLQKNERKLCSEIAFQKSLTRLIACDDELNNRFAVLVENVDLAKEFLSDPKVRGELIRAIDFLKCLSLNRKES